MYALVDANSFYASAEKVFDPSIRRKPVVVLTNNDGCICAMCKLAKQTGVKKFGPYHQVKDQLAKFGCVIRSSNYELYDDLSRKMMQVIREFAPEQHVYSIDECFLYFGDQTPETTWEEHGRSIRATVWQQLRLPVGVGIGPTPTLAKVASYAGKKLTGFRRNVAVLDTPKKIEYALKHMTPEDVWGIGRRINKRLAMMGIHTAWDLAQCCPKALRKQFSVEIERTVRELRGEPCMHWDAVRDAKQQIFSTRAFGEKVTDMLSLRQSLCLHAEKVGAKARAQGSAIKALHIFAQSNPFSTDQYYKQSLLHRFAVPTADTTQLVSAVTQAVPQIFQLGVIFHKSGVGAVELVQNEFIQEDFFAAKPDKPGLMSCLDAINRRYGSHTLGVAAKGITPKWTMRRQYLSPQYTTSWADIPKIQCR
jgi:DNA polymerase V